MTRPNERASKPTSNNNNKQGRSVINTRKRSFSSSTSSSSSTSNTPSPNLFSPSSTTSNATTSASRSSMETRSSQKRRQTLPSSDDSDMSSSSPQPSSSDNSSTTGATPIPQRIFVQRNVPAFLNKLYSMVNDPSTDNLIHWSKDGNSFIVEGHEQFAKSVLPRFYKHNTFASFVRQLNMYDFHKIPHLQQGVLISDSKHERWEFSNPNFQRGRPEMLVLVTRKRNRERGTDDEEISLSTVVRDIAAIRKHQISISNELHTIQRDNAVLWEDTLTAREKHQRHQEVIGKILQFLTIVFSNNDRLPSSAAAALQQQIGGNNHGGLQNISKHSQLSSSFTGIRLMEEHSSSHNNDSLVIRSRQENDNSSSTDKSNHAGMTWKAPAVSRQLIKEAATLAGMTVPEENPSEREMSGKCLSSSQTLSTTLFDILTAAKEKLYSSRIINNQSSAGLNNSSESASSSSSATPSSISTQSTSNSATNSFGNTAATTSINTSVTPPSSIPYQTTHGQPQVTTVSNRVSSTQAEAVLSSALPALASLPYTMLRSIEDNPDYSSSTASFQNGITDIGGGVQNTAQTVDSAARSVHAISQDIEDLQVNVEALANDLGINPGQLLGNSDFSGYYDQFADDYSRLIASATEKDRNQLFELASHRYHQQKQLQQQQYNNSNLPYINDNHGNCNDKSNEINGVSIANTTSVGSFPYHPASAFLWKHYYSTSDGAATATSGASTFIPQNNINDNPTRWSTDTTYAYNLACSFLQQQLTNRTIAARRAFSASRPHRVPSPVLRTSVESSFCTSSAPPTVSQQTSAPTHPQQQQQVQQQPAVVPVPVPVPVAMMPISNTSQQAQQYQAQFAQQMSLQQQQQQQFPVLSEEYMAFLTAQAQQTYAGMAAAAAAANPNHTIPTTIGDLTASSTIAHPQQEQRAPLKPNSEQPQKQ